MIDRVVALGGPPGSGKTTAARRLAERLNLELRSAGERFRAEAASRGLDLGEFSRYAELHPEVDRALDEGMVALARPGRLLEGRLTGALLRRRGVPVHWLAVVAPAEVRAGRIAQRDHLDVEEARRSMELREESERRRYLRYYAVDLGAERPDFSVDSTNLAPDGVVAALEGYLRGAGGSVGR